MANQTDENLLKVKIISPKEDLFDDLALSVSSKNSAGKFDILPQHANFITLIHDTPITIVKPDKQPQTFQFPFAIIYNINNKVSIYTDIPVHIAQN